MVLLNPQHNRNDKSMTISVRCYFSIFLRRSLYIANKSLENRKTPLNKKKN